MEQRGLGRRRLVTGILAGGVAGASSTGTAQAKAGRSPDLVPAKKLRPGYVIVGPGATVVRVASVDKLPSGRRRVRGTDPHTGAAVPLAGDVDRTGFPSRYRFVVLARGATVASVRLTGPTPVTPTVIDGGAP
ncbi:hypothetical protein [Nocardioides dilutus]